ncbi:glycosyltransferase family 2 protein [Candidatus Roizmanbacteria bacterium]|nr:glycosyltransferase family 2 protein [Candidatus Roizmanbacteria bacterium]
MKPDVFIIIIHWNTPELLRKQLSLLKKDNNLQIIVIDNSSRKSVDWILSEFEDIQLIKNTVNRGFAFACNQGTVKAAGEWLLFLNPDVEISSQQIERMLNFAKEQNLDACSPKPMSDNYDSPVATPLALLAEFTPLSRILPKKTLFNPKTLTGGCLLIKENVLKNLGGWDERFFLWYEDSDLTLRLMKTGHKIGWAPIKIQHVGGASFEKLDKQLRRDIFFHSMDVFAKKHFSPLGQLIISLIKKRYTRRKVLPQLHEGVDITVPNMKIDLLKLFFYNNGGFLDEFNELIVVSSSLSANNIWDWRRKYPQVRFIPINKNYGVASTINMGFRASTSKWMGTINDDVTLSKGSLTNLLQCAKENSGSLNPSIYHDRNTIESMGVQVLKYGKAAPIKKIVNKKCFEADSVNGAAVLFANAALNKVGLFDERFGSYLEDIDLSMRISRGGYKNIIAPSIKVLHAGQSSSKNLGIKKQWYDFRNWIYVIVKNWSLKDLIFNLPSIFIERLRNLSGVLKAF